MAQNTSSPYSVLGIGDIESSYYNRYTGMANSSVALSDNRYINNANAASLTDMVPRFYTFEVSGRFQHVLYSGNAVDLSNNQTSDMQVKRLNLAVKITKRWGTSLGLLPYSTVNYNFVSSKSLEGTQQFATATYQGQGGINQVFWGNGYRITRNTSIGVTSSILFGSLTQIETLQTGNDLNSLVTTSSNFLHNFYFNFSLLSKLKLSKHWESSYGITFSPRTSLMSQESIGVTDVTGATIKATKTNNGYFDLPVSINAGIALVKNNKYTYTINAKNDSWNDLNYSAQGYQLVNSNRLSLGFQSSNLKQNYYKQTYEQGFFQLGLYAGNSYLKVNNEQLTDFGVSMGYGRNSFRSPLGWVASLSAGRQGSQNTNIVSQNYLRLTFTLSYLDIFNSNKKQ
ncbi:MAG TPA: hypothetical protein VIJ75_10220 [Hanamia sp.]